MISHVHTGVYVCKGVRSCIEQPPCTFNWCTQEARAAQSEAQRRSDAAGHETAALREQSASIEASANERIER